MDTIDLALWPIRAVAMTTFLAGYALAELQVPIDRETDNAGIVALRTARPGPRSSNQFVGRNLFARPLEPKFQRPRNLDTACYANGLNETDWRGHCTLPFKIYQT